jgi:hypothetical protein
MMDYFVNHWKGKLSLPVSYWVNIVILNIIFFYVTESIAIRIKHPYRIIDFILISSVIYYFTIYLWQIIGNWRCSKRYINDGKKFWASIVRIILIISTFFIIPRFLNLLKLREVNYDEINKLGYTIDLVDEGSKIHIIGGMKYGLSDEIQDILEKNEKIKGIIIDSYGGLVYEGYKLAEIIKRNNLNTYSIIECSSAATIAFIAGTERFIINETKMGFHNPFSILDLRKDFQLNALELNTARKQKKLSKSDYLNFLHKNRIADNFIMKLENYDSKDLFYPTIDELTESGIITGVQSKSTVLIKQEWTNPNLTSLINNWINVSIPDVCIFEISPAFEIQEGIFKELNNTISEKVLEITHNRERVVLQPKGVNEFDESALNNYCRFIIETEFSDEPLFELTDSIVLTEDELLFFEEIIRSSIEDGMKQMRASGVDMKILEWNRLKIFNLNNIDALEFSYTRQLNQNPHVFVKIYKVFNRNKIHTITVSYRISEKKLWSVDLNNMLNSIQFIESKK